MELRFVIASLRKWWAVAVLGAVAGALAAASVAGPGEQRFRSTAVLAIEAPNAGPASADREVAEEIAVLRSRALTEQVAARESVPAYVIASEVTVSQQPGTDLVNIVATDPNRQRARSIAQAVVEEYIALERRRDEERRRGEFDTLSQRAAAIETEIKGLSQLPPTEASAPDVVAQRARKEQEYRALLEARVELLVGARSMAREVIEPATPASPVPRTRSQLMLVAGLLCGGALGLALATVLGRFSRWAIDDLHAGEILGAPLVARIKIPAARGYGGDKPPRWSPDDKQKVNIVSAQLQTMVTLDAPLRVAVVTGDRGAGATAVSLAFAWSLGRTGERVVLIDADDRNPELSAVCPPPDGAEPAATGGGLVPCPSSLGPDNGGDTPVILTRGPSESLRRGGIRGLLAKAVAAGDLVVADGGPLSDSAPAGELCHTADVVVFVVRRRKQRIDVLETAAMRLSDIRERVLVVSVSLQEPSRRQRRQAARADRHRSKETVLLPQ